MVNTLNGWEKAIAQAQKTADQIEALNSKLEDFKWEFRALLASHLMTFPQFDGSEVLVWLARANQYFLLNKTPSERRIDFAMAAIDGPAKPWKQLLVQRCPSLSWDRFVHELLSRFGETIPPESCVLHSNPPPQPQPVHSSPTPKPQPQPLPLHSGPPPQPQPQPQPVHSSPTPKPQPQPLPLHSSPPPQPQPQPQPQFATTPTLLSAPMLLPLLQQKLFLTQSSADIPQFQPPLFPLRRHTVPVAAAEQVTLMYLFLLVYGYIPWVSLAAPVQKHEWEPPPNKIMGFNFELSLEDKAVLRVRQLIRMEFGRYTHVEAGELFTQPKERILRKKFSKPKVRKWWSEAVTAADQISAVSF